MFFRSHLYLKARDSRVVVPAKALDHGWAADLLEGIEQGGLELNPMAIGVNNEMRQARYEARPFCAANP